MRFFYYFFLSFIFFSINNFSQENIESLLIEKELNPHLFQEAKAEAIRLGLPLSINIDNNILISPLKMAEGKILYSVFTDFANPLNGAEILTYNEITGRFDLSNAEITYGNSAEPVNTEATFTPEKLLLVPDWTNDNVLSFDPVSGDLVNANFIPNSAPNLASPKEAVLNSRGFVTVSDQIADAVQRFDTSGAYLNLFAPAGGVNTAILDNLRGHTYLPNGNLLVAVGSSGNQNSIPQFDSDGNYIGQFITTGSGGLSSPFGILIRSGDILVTASGSNRAHRYSLEGATLGDFITGMNFPQQIIELPNGNIAIAVFSSPTSGLRIFSPTGTLISAWSSVTGNRGVWPLGNGNFLTTNSTGLHELSGTDGTLIRTVHAGSNMQFITLYDYSIVPVELTGFTANVINNNVRLNWATASEVNNKGFEIERNFGNVWEKIGFVEGYGTTTEKQNYSFVDNKVNSGKYSYRLKQIDFNGSFEYSNIVEVDFNAPLSFKLDQNYPNPFNPSTRISYSVSQDGIVNLEIYNLLGEKVSTLLNEFKEAGKYEVEFSANELSSGIYFYKLASGSFNEIRKMILMR